MTGIDLTPNAIEHTRKRLKIYQLTSNIRVGDAEKSPFDDCSFDLVYSWEVLHHSPSTPEAVDEVFCVLRPDGIAKIMIYHKYYLTGYMLWVRYGLLAGHPFRSLDDIYHHHLESPGTKAYSIKEAKVMFSRFSSVDIKTQLGFGDLLEGAVGQRHRGIMLSMTKRFWPRILFKTIFKKHGLMLLIEVKK